MRSRRIRISWLVRSVVVHRPHSQPFPALAASVLWVGQPCNYSHFLRHESIHTGIREKVGTINRAPTNSEGTFIHKIRIQIFFSLLGCLLIVLLAACGSGNPPTANGTPTSSSTPGATATATSGSPKSTPTSSTGSGSTPATPDGGTTPVPTTQTSCPAAGTTRAAVMATLALGNHPNIVYIVNGPSGLGTLKRYDVTTGAKTEIVNLANTTISEAQVSADGQWILFTTIVGKQAKLQLIRMDGQGLQTLYCPTTASNGADPASALDYAQWSINQRFVIFNSYTNQGAYLYLLNIQSGSVQREF